MRGHQGAMAASQKDWACSTNPASAAAGSFRNGSASGGTPSGWARSTSARTRLGSVAATRASSSSMCGCGTTGGGASKLGQVVRPATFNRIIERIGKDHEARPEIMEQLLRTQMQARYSPEPLGHFGLALASYAHFTSPIRRYADLLVHRALVGDLPKDDADKFVEIGEHISMLERRAMEAERETIDRYVAAFLSDKVGQILRCRITGVQPFGFFATVEDLGGDGLVPAAILGNEYYRYDEAARALVGEETGETYRVGQHLELKLVEANPASGALRFERYPSAPAFSTRLGCAVSSCAESTSTRACLSRAISRRTVSMPPMPGIERSMMTTSGFVSGYCRYAASPLSASPTTSIDALPESSMRKPTRTTAWSSTSITRVFAFVIVIPVGALPARAFRLRCGW